MIVCVKQFFLCVCAAGRYDDVLYNPVIDYDISDTVDLTIRFNTNTSLRDINRIVNHWKSFLVGYTGSGCHFGSDSYNLCYELEFVDPVCFAHSKCTI